MSDPNDLAAFLDFGWQRLARGVADRHAPARHPVFATVSPDGKPEARTVVLRAADRQNATLEFHTDVASAKTRSLERNPHAQLHVWDDKAKLQLRLSTTVHIETGRKIAHKWQNVPEGSRVAYGASPTPGTAIEHAHAYEKLAHQDWFAVLTCRLDQIELMQLSDPHRRAIFKAETDWRGQWVVP